MAHTSITLRVDSGLTDTLEDLSRSRGVSLSNFINSILIGFLNNNKNALQKDKLKHLKQIELKHKRLLIAEEWKSNNRDLYLIKNTIRTITDLLLYDYLLGREIDMTVVNNQIDFAVKIYNSMNPEMKRLMKDKIESLKRLTTDSEFLISRLVWYSDLKKYKMIK